MTISYNWLCEYLPVKIEPAKLSVILTSLGLEVENFERKEEIPGSLEGLIIGEVLEVTSHPNADKLRITRVSTGGEDKLRIVCGAPNGCTGRSYHIPCERRPSYYESGKDQGHRKLWDDLRRR